MSGRRLFGEVVDVKILTRRTKEALYVLFSRHYDEVSRARFEEDLREKPWILLLTDSDSGEVGGFSTLLLLERRVDGRPIRALFSGDTIVDPRYWGSLELVRVWIRFAAELKATAPALPLYWFLISKGYRTYLFLPLYFRAFYPRFDQPTPPFEERVLDALASSRYGAAFDPARGVIEFPRSHGQLKPELAAVEEHRRKNPHVRFFLQRNPTYSLGTELVCLAEISPRNMRRLPGETLSRALEQPAQAAAEAL